MPAADDVGQEMATVAPTDDATEADQSGPRASLAELYQFASAFEKLVLAVAVVGAVGRARIGLAQETRAVQAGDAHLSLW